MDHYSEFVKRHTFTEKKETQNRKRSYSSEAANLNIANGFFVDNKISFIPSYEKLINEQFNGKIQSTDFKRKDETVKVNSISQKIEIGSYN